MSAADAGAARETGARRRRLGKLRPVPLFLVLAGLGAAHAFWVEPAWIEVTRHEVAAKLAAPLRVAHLSDLHARGLGRRERSWLAAVERERPDAVVITGDFFVDAASNDGAFDVMRRLHAPLGVWAVMGNWEHWRPAGRLRERLVEAGVRLLVNESARLRDDAWLVGLDDELGGAPDPNGALAGVPAGAFALALIHSPAGFEAIAGRVPVALAGHTHGGQIRLPLLGAPWTPPGSGAYVAGWYEREGSRLYVSRGLGNSVIDARFWCRPEVALLTFR